MSKDDATEFGRTSGNDNRGQDDRDVDWMEAMKAHNVDADTPLNESQIMELLANVVEGEIIPRLMMAHQTFAGLDMGLATNAKIEDDDLVQFCTLTLDGEVDDLEDYVIERTRKGIATETIYVDLMAPTARRLGQMWEHDDISFTDVTIGLGRLQTLLYRLSARQKGIRDVQVLVPRGLFVTVEGAQHSFGIRMAEDLFRRAGWKTLCEPNIPLDEVIGVVQSDSFDLLGIGISIDAQIEPTRTLIDAVRKHSRNGAIQVMVGGSLIVDRPEIAKDLGAELSACDAREAVTIAQNIIYEQKLRH
jgi:methanogenic corrinoid protein MtbC1